MFIDLAFVEGESVQVAGYRGGAKMRAKKDGGDYPVASRVSDATSPIEVYQAGMGRCAGDAMKPVRDEFLRRPFQIDLIRCSPSR